MLLKSVFQKVLSELRSGLVIAIALLLTVAAAIAGPFNTFIAFSMGERAIYWGLVVTISLVLSFVIRITISEVMKDAPYWQRAVLLVAAMTLILTPVLVIMNEVGLRGRGLEHLPFWRLALFVAAISSLVIIVRYFVEISKEVPSTVATPTVAAQAADQTADQAAAPPPRLHARLPEGHYGLIHRLSADDHFVLVHTENGAHQVRMRFADAIAEMDNVIGYCTHRSHWVVATAIEGVEREGAKLFLCISGGARVPVSRKYRPRLEAAGQIDL